jgi:hypothetical protein
MRRDSIYESFLTRQAAEGKALAAESDILRLVPLGGSPPDRYIVEFACAGLVRNDSGEVSEASHFVVGIRFPADYLRRAHPTEVLTWFGPAHVFHPNISDVAPVICVGRLAPGTSLVDLIHQCFEIVTFKKVTMREDDALNRAACAWSRENQHRFPIDRRPLKRQELRLRVEGLRTVTP